MRNKIPEAYNLPPLNGRIHISKLRREFICHFPDHDKIHQRCIKRYQVIFEFFCGGKVPGNPLDLPARLKHVEAKHFLLIIQIWPLGECFP